MLGTIKKGIIADLVLLEADPRFDGTKPVAGAEPSTEWRGDHTMEEVPQPTNPPSGWMQNCNSTVFLLTGQRRPSRKSKRIRRALIIIRAKRRNKL